MLRQVREKRRFTLDQAVATLPVISKKRFEQWEDGWRLPSSFVQTLVVWRLNTAPEPHPEALSSTKRRLRWGSALLPGLSVALLVMAVTALLNKPLSGSKHDLSLEAIIAQSASDAQDDTVSPETYLDYANRLESTLTQLSDEERRQVFGDLSEAVETVID